MEVSDPLFVSSFVLEFVGVFYWIFYLDSEYLFIPLSPLHESIIWLVESLILLSGSWFVFISEMSTLSDGSWAELSMSMW